MFPPWQLAGPILAGVLGVSQLAIAGDTSMAGRPSTVTPTSSAVPAATQAASACPEATGAALADFFDRTIPVALEETGAPGAVVSVISGQSLVFADGYGLADVESGVAFSPSRSLVRIGSITKLFTWTAVMQQVEAGRLDLDADVNQYLPNFQIPATYPQPVTLRHLMNHTAGFEDFSIGTQVADAADLPPLGEYLAAHLPARIRPPGQVSAYSNYGAALAGYIVSVVTGEPYDVYIRNHLLEPLAMAHSTASEPVPAHLRADLARSYDTEAVPPQPIPFTFVPQAPDGSMSATATDMANFMIAHLNDGRFGDASILEPATVAQMHSRSFAAHPGLDGYAHGFKELTVNGRRTLMHDGGWEGFRSGLVLVPGCDLGLFLSFNGSTGGVAGYEILLEFLDRFAPPPATPEATGPQPASTLTPAEPLAGFYHSTRQNESTIEKLVTVLGSLSLSVAADGTVRFRGQHWTPQPDGLYHSSDGRERLAFLVGPDGHRYVVTDRTAYELMSSSETLPVNLAVLLVMVLPALAAAGWPAVWAIRRLRGRPARSTTAGWRMARGLGVGAAVGALLFLVRLVVVLLGDTSDFSYGVPRHFHLLLVLPIVVLAVGVAAVVLTIKEWRGSGAGWFARVHQVGILAGLAAFAWFVGQWNLLGWQYP